MSPNDIFFSTFVDGVVAAGGIITGFAAESKESEMVNSCKVANVTWLFAAPQLLDLALRVAQDVEILDSRVSIFDPPGLQSGSRSNDSSKRLRFSHLLEAHDERSFVNFNTDKDPSQWTYARLFTRGTTGSPKAANISHAAHISRTKDESNVGYTGKRLNRYLHFIGMHHVSGMPHSSRTAIGRHRMHVTTAQQPAQIVDLIEKYGIQSVVLPPRTMIAITDMIRNGTRTKDQISSLRHVTVGGSQAPNETMDEFKVCLSKEADLRIAYDLTELGSFSTGSWEAETSASRRGYVGQIAPGREAKILDPESAEDCGFDTDGEICGSSSQLLNDYCLNQRATDEALMIDEEGKRWFRTGDRGRLSASGELCVTGRFKEIFKVGTEEVAPAEVELVMLRHAGVKDVAVTATKDRHDPRYYEVKAFAVPNETGKPEAQELVEFVASNLSAHKAPTGGVTMVKQIPRNATKKVVTRDLAAAEPLPGSVGYMNVLKN